MIRRKPGDRGPRCAPRPICLRRGQRLVEAPGDNRKVYGFGLVDWRDGWFDGRVAPGRTANVFCEQVRAAVARSKQRRRVAIVIADNLKTHTPTGSLLVRSMLAEFQEHLYVVYTPAYDPDANRIEWLWRVSRRVVTHNHHRCTFELLLADVERHFQALAQAPAEVLRHIGSIQILLHGILFLAALTCQFAISASHGPLS